MREPEGGYPSRFFDSRKPVAGEQYPSDIISAWKRALRLAPVRFERAGQALDSDAIWAARRVIVAQAEAEADQVLQNSRGMLDRLADELLRGPMAGIAVRGIIED